MKFKLKMLTFNQIESLLMIKVKINLHLNQYIKFKAINKMHLIFLLMIFLKYTLSRLYLQH